MNDYKYHVYRLTNENELATSGPIELLDSDDEETGQTNGNGSTNTSTNIEDSEDECPSADEMDVKPDIHALMRKMQEEMKIKEEVNWNCYEYDRETAQREPDHDAVPVDNVDLDQFDVESEIFVNEPPQKRQRYEPMENVAPMFNDVFVQPEQQNVLGDENDDEHVDANVTASIASEYQMSDTTLKEKVKNVVRSRGQQLAIDMLIAAQSKDKSKSAVATASAGGNRGMPTNNPIASTSKASTKPPSPSPSPDIPTTYGGDDYDIPLKSIGELEIDFITEITKWKYKWIEDKNLNPLQYTMNVRHLDTDFTHLQSFQQFVSNFSTDCRSIIPKLTSKFPYFCCRQMKNFLLMETYSIIFTAYGEKNMSAHSFTEVTSSSFDRSNTRLVFQCFSKFILKRLLP